MDSFRPKSTGGVCTCEDIRKCENFNLKGPARDLYMAEGRCYYLIGGPMPASETGGSRGERDIRCKTYPFRGWGVLRAW